MTESFAPDALFVVFGRDGADVERRHRAAAIAADLHLPSTESEGWRHSPIAELDLSSYAPQLRQAIAAPPATSLVVPDVAASIVVVNGHATRVQVDPRWSAMGLSVAVLGGERPEPSDGDTKLDALHLAFAPQAVRITVPDGLNVDAPIVIRHHHLGDGAAAFPHLVVTAGNATSLNIIEHQTSVDGTGMIVGLAEVSVGDHSDVGYVVVQDLGRQLWQSQRIRTTVGRDGAAHIAMAAFGGTYARVHTDTDLADPGAHLDLAGLVYADASQTIDVRNDVQHHAARTTSDLLFDGAVDGRARSIYAGTIHVHGEGAGSMAEQTNRTLELSADARSWSAPTFEVEHHDVGCRHISTVGPVDGERLDALSERGLDRGAAERLVIDGFFDEVAGRFRADAIDEVRRLITAKLDARAVAAPASADRS